MNLGEFRKITKGLPDDMEIILQKDSEGNEYRPAAGADPDCIYVPEESWYGAVYRTTDSAGDNLMTEKEWDELKAGPKCLVIYPIN